jgi:hypothetical protein
MSIDRALPMSPQSVLLHSQLHLPRRPLSAKSFAGDTYESLWVRVNRICDRYIPNAEDTVPAESD